MSSTSRRHVPRAEVADRPLRSQNDVVVDGHGSFDMSGIEIDAAIPLSVFLCPSAPVLALRVAVGLLACLACG